MSYKYRFSIFTATYNRAEYLKKVYECLCKQTFQDFEWIIVDDGSSDNTSSIVQSLITVSSFSIRYFRHERNSGKHIAWKTATAEMQGLYAITADDDDTFPDNALEIFHHQWLQLEQSPNYEYFWEVRGRCSVDGKTIFGPLLPSNILDSDYNEVNYCFKVRGLEMSGCRKVDVLKGIAAVPHHFIYDSECSNFAESIRWSRAARLYKTRFISDVVRYYNISTSGLTRNNRGRRRTYNMLVGEIYTLNEQHDLLLRYDKIRWLKEIFSFTYHNIRLGHYRLCDLKHISDRIISVALYIPSFIVQKIRK